MCGFEGVWVGGEGGVRVSWNQFLEKKKSSQAAQP